MRLFEGTEVEGQFRGLWTLFVEGDVPFEEIYSRVNNGYGQVYFGAGRCSEINWDTVIRVCRTFNNIVTAEISKPVPIRSDFQSNLHIVVNLDLSFNASGDSESRFRVLHSIRPFEARKVQLKFDVWQGGNAWLTRTYVLPFRTALVNSQIEIHDDKELWRDETSSKS